MKKIISVFVILAGLCVQANAQNVFPANGNVGIGTLSPSAKLEINHEFPYTFIGQAPPPIAPAFRIYNTNGYYAGNIMEIKNGDPISIFLGIPPATYFAVRGDGLVSMSNRLQIGPKAANGSYANYKLSVDGDMIAKRCVIQVANWADYVFKADYKLPALTEVETYIDQNGHLPGVPCEADVLEKGMEVGEMNTILLQKVEELTLYLIEMQKQNEALNARIADLESAK